MAGRPVSATERVRALRAATGLPITLDDVSPEEAPAVLAEVGMEPHDIEHLLSTLSWFAENDDDSFKSTEELLGRPLRTFETWAQEHAADFR